MRGGFKVNFDVAEAIAIGSQTDAVVSSEAINTHNQRGVTFLVNVGTLGTSVDVAVEYSDDGVTWTEDADRAVAAVAGLNEININGVQHSFYRVTVTNAGTSIYGASAIVGPHRMVAV
ncbi:hypothetical protein SAMN04487962_12519 [Marinobacter segnicrescens]|uniref:F5/8 type C domain-containing protein n=1 Tax=Marinobacter segnicrescens TaxID=430453 RepID=A0A1I0HAC0_9GAMM|nr:hypothetical protein [Marinobacter segnicrescens]SET79781.1 hypothetical protein SAMN04487962_12519 [Marinobacter segnicrescens]